jgi:hypothetical protein
MTPSHSAEIPLEQYFDGAPEARALFDLAREKIESVGESTMRATKSQVAFRRRLAFAWLWMPGRYATGKHPPLELTVGLLREDTTTLWKQVVETKPGHFMHHLDLETGDEIDAAVLGALREAWDTSE